MGIKETPTNFRVYYKNLKDKYTVLKEKLIEEYNSKQQEEKVLYNDIKSNKDIYIDNFKINLFDYEEFVDNKYINGSLYQKAKTLFINRKEHHTIVNSLFDLFRFAKKQKELYELEKQINLCNKVIQLSLKDYTELLKVYYTEIHKLMILKGYGYVFSGLLGWICINRCRIKKAKPHIDYAATKKRKLALIAEGKRLYNKDEAAWCEQNGIEYNAVDSRVYMHNEYCYEIPLIGCKLNNGRKLKLVISDYRGSNIRGKSNEDLAHMCNNNLNDICELPVDLKTKLTICDSVDKILYTNFIRNENQEPINATKTDRKNRQ